jgi:hypothetical protein
MWYRTAIDLGSLFGRKKLEETPPPSPSKPDVPNDVFKEYVRQSIPRPISQIETGLGDQHLILTGTGDLHQGVSHSMFLDRVLDEARKKINKNPELREQYNVHRLPENAYGPEDLVQRRKQNLGPNENYYQEDAVTEILHDYFDQGIRISNMAGIMSVNAVHLPSLMQIQKIFEIIHLLQPNTVQFDIKADKGQFREVYDIDDVADFKRDILEFKIHGQRQQSTMRDWRRL